MNAMTISALICFLFISTVHNDSLIRFIQSFRDSPFTIFNGVMFKYDHMSGQSFKTADGNLLEIGIANNLKTAINIDSVVMLSE